MTFILNITGKYNEVLHTFGVKDVTLKIMPPSFKKTLQELIPVMKIPLVLLMLCHYICP